MRALPINHPEKAPAEKAAVIRKVKQPLDLSFHDYLWPLAFMLSATMIGLNFPLGYIFMLFILINRWLNDRYDFIIQFTIFSGGYSLFLPYVDLFFPYDKCIFLLSVLLLFIYNKNKLEKKIFYLIVVYAVILVCFARLSDESMRIQFTGLVNWLSIVYFIIPMVCFGKEDFDVKIFLKKIFPYFFIICCYYIIDGVILSSNFMIPRDSWAVSHGYMPKFYDYNIYPFAFYNLRLWPQPLYLSLFVIYAISKYFKMNLWQWLLFFAALAICRTFTLYISLLICWVLCQGKVKQMLLFCVYALLAFGILYLVDSEPEKQPNDEYQSALRVRSSVKQFTDLFNAKDEEDLANFGSKRMAVVLPAMELLYDQHKEWVGLGFLDAAKTTKSKYIMTTDIGYDDDDPRREMVVTGIEIVPLQVILSIGYIGLLIHCVVYLLLWLLVRKLKYASLFGIITIGFVLLGLSGFSGLAAYQGLFLTGLSLAAVLLANKKELDTRIKKVKPQIDTPKTRANVRG